MTYNVFGGTLNLTQSINQSIMHSSYSLHSHECAPVGCVFSLLQNDVSVSVGSRSDNGKEFHSFWAQAAKLRGAKVEVRQASTCRSPRVAERKWRRLVPVATGMHSSWRYSGVV